MSVCVCVCLWIQSVVPNLGARWENRRRRFAPSNDGPQSSTCRRGVDVTATLLALLRHKSRRRRAPRPDAGPPTHAIAGTRARAVTMATVRPPSLLNHITPGGWQAAVRHDTVVSRRRRRHATAASSDFFCVPFGGRANGRVSTPRPTPSPTTARPGRRVCRLRRLRPALPASSPMCAETCNWASDADCDDGGPGFRPALGRRHCGPDHRLMW